MSDARSRSRPGAQALYLQGSEPMKQQTLIEMANQIGEFFDSMPDHEEALQGISDHLRRYWAPRMRLQILDSLATDQSSEMTPIVREALRRDESSLRPR